MFEIECSFEAIEVSSVFFWIESHFHIFEWFYIDWTLDSFYSCDFSAYRTDERDSWSPPDSLSSESFTNWVEFVCSERRVVFLFHIFFILD